jgi:predicted Zn finger-like uncharacterized protein
MPFRFTCPHCGAQTNVADEYLGRSGPCGRCGRTITIGRPGPAFGGAPGMTAASPGSVRSAGSGVACPKCGGYSQRAGPWPWYLGTIGAMLVKAVVCNRCGHQFDAKKPAADLAKRKFHLALLLNAIGAAGILLIVGMLVTLALSLK